MTATWDVDICVIGGGPAGSTIGRCLAQLGHRVCIVEKTQFPRSHIGESLPPSILPLLESLGLLASIEQAGFLRTRRTLLRWASVQRDDPPPGAPQGFQVDRGRFDQLLLEAARQAGVIVFNPAKVQLPASNPVDTWQIPLWINGCEHSVHARLLVDASGKAGCLGGIRQRTASVTLAAFAYWSEVPFNGTETRVEDGPECWYWGAPLPDGTFNATVFFDPDRYKAVGRNGLEALYRSLLAGSSLLRDCLHGRLVQPVRCCDATSYASKEPVGNNWIKVGEASFSIDPLSSQGVQTAMGTAVGAAAVINTLLHRPGSSDLAIEFYRTRQSEMIIRHHQLATGSYALQQSYYDTLFWKRRAMNQLEPHPHVASIALPLAELYPHSNVRLADCVRIVETGVLRNNYIESASALIASHWDRPVAFVHEVPVAELAESVRQPQRVVDILGKWSNRIPWDQCEAILGWMWQSGLLEFQQ